VKNGLGVPVEIFLLCPQYLKPETDSQGNIIRYRYGKGSTQVEYDPDEVIPFLLPNPSCPWLDGYSPLYSVYGAINIEDKLEATTAAILDNSGRPDGILTAKDGIAHEEAQRWEYKFSERFRKAGNGGVIVLDEDATFTPLTFSPRDLSWLAIHDTSRLSIANAYGVPYALIDKDGSTQYNVDVTLRQRHVEDAIVPRLRRNQSVLNRYLVSLFDDSGKLFLAFDDASPTNRELKLREDSELVKAGIKTQNEVRVERGLEPHVDGDRLAVPAGASLASDGKDGSGDSTDATGATPEAPEGKPEAEGDQDIQTLPQNTLNGAQITSGLAIVQAVAAGQLPRDSGLGALMVLLNLSREQAEQIMGSVGDGFKPTAPAPVEKPPVSLPNPTPSDETKGCCARKPRRKAHFAEKKNRERGKKLAAVLQKCFASQRKQVLGALGKGFDAAKTKALPARFVPMKKWDRELYEGCQPLVELWVKDDYQTHAKDLVARSGVSDEVFDVTNPHLQEQIDRLALQFCQETNTCTTQKLNDALAALKESFAEGMTEGERMTQLTKRVEEIFDSAEEERAGLIATTESSRSHNLAALQSAKDSGVVSGSKLLPSSGACDLCLSIAEEGEVALGDDFYSDPNAPDAYQDKASPPIHPGCECVLEMVLTQETPPPDAGPGTEGAE
jgi:HK97 family phage portal protein